MNDLEARPVPISEEITPKLYPTFTPPENSDERFLKRLYDFDLAIQCLGVMKGIVDERTSRPSVVPLPVDREHRDMQLDYLRDSWPASQKLREVKEIMSLLCRPLEEHLINDKGGPVDRNVIRGQAVSYIRELAINDGIKDSDNIMGVAISDEEELNAAAERFRVYLHDLGNSLTSLSGFIELSWVLKKDNNSILLKNETVASNYAVVQRKLTDLAKQTSIQRAQQELASIFPYEDVKLEVIQGVLSSTLYPDLTINGVEFSSYVDEEVTRDIAVDWSVDWIKRLMGNIGQNTDRTYQKRDTDPAYSDRAKAPKTLEVRLEVINWNDPRFSDKKTKLSPGDKYLFIQFKDQGKGFSEQIVESETFPQGKSEFGGEGLGMSGQQKVLASQYKGFIIPGNEVGDNGEFKYAITSVLLPLKK